MTTDLVSKAIIKAHNLRPPPIGLVYHSGRGHNTPVRDSMGDVGACWDNAVAERFFGYLKYDWLLKVPQPTRKYMRTDVAAYIHYYNLERLHTANGDLSPAEYELSSLRKVS